MAVAAAIVVASCTGGDSTAPETTVAVTTTTTLPARPADDQLTIGLLLPASDPLLGQGLIDAATLAVRQINAAGGVLEKNVRIVEADEGTTEAAATEAISRLIEEDVDAVVGPASSLIALSNLDDLVSAGIVTCSPTASAIALDDFPDDGLFFRTIPSDSLQAVAIADVAERTGVQDVAIVYVDDAYGRPFGDAVEESLAERPVTATRYRIDRSDPDFESVAQDVVGSDAAVVVVVAGTEDSTAFLQALDDTNTQSLSTIIVNDTMRDPLAQQLVATFDPEFRELIVGVAPQALAEGDNDIFSDPGLFAANAFDCVNLIALAALRLNSDDPSLIENQIVSLTIGGRICSSFEQCAQRLDDNLEINYSGPTGIMDMLLSGDLGRARFDQFRFDDVGQVLTESPLTSSAF